MGERGKKVLSILLKLLGSLFLLAVLAFLYVVLIVAQPQETEQAPEAVSRPLQSAVDPITVSHEADLRSLVVSFPVPVMSFMSGSGMVFVSGASADTPYAGGFARTITLYWQTPEGQPLILQSIYPADLALLGKGDYAFSAVAGPTLFGGASVRMETEETVRVHALTSGGLYAVTVPRELASSLSSLSRSIQLFTAE